MTEHKYTDEEVIKDLQSACKWFEEHGKNTNRAIVGICERAVDLINRQKAEIERLKSLHDLALAEQRRLAKKQTDKQP